MWRPLFLLTCAAIAFAAAPYFQIRIVDDESGRGVPLAEIRTTNKISLWTDSNGVIAWNEPGLMDRDVYFQIESPGYSIGGGGRTMHITGGGSVEIKLQRNSIAERLYRFTGQGIYRDSVLTGASVPVREPVLNSGVMGQDTVRAVPYRQRLFWLWGDTDRPSGPLGNFNTTSATSDLRDDPDRGINLNYFIGPNGFVKQMIPWTKRMTWMHSLMLLRDPAGEERLVAYYEVVRKLGDVERSGLAVFNDAKQEFDPLVVFPVVPKFHIDGLTLRVRDYYYFTGLHQGAAIRVRADWKAVQDLSSYEVFDGTSWKSADPRQPAPSLTHYTDAETGDSLPIHCDSIVWNDYRRRWIAVLERQPGEVWYAEADSPTGPWIYATRVAVHGKYTFYWPALLPFFDRDGGRIVYFAGTYTDSFSGNPVITPRYDYNQIMYRMKLDDARLFLPAPVYRLRDGRYLMGDGVTAAHGWQHVESIPFFALAPDRQRAGTVSVKGLFAALPLESEMPSRSAVGNWSCKWEDDLEFKLGIDSQGGILIQVFGEAHTKGSYRDGVLRADVEDTHIEGQYREGKLSGQNFTCMRPDGERWRTSKALVPLYFYAGRYTTEVKPGEQAIARVWRNPSNSLALDPIVRDLP